MRISISQSLITGLGLFAMQATAATQCDLSWVGSSLSAASSTNGHIVVVRGTDGNLRFNEWRDASNAYSGWTLLPGTNFGSDPWIQAFAVNDLVSPAVSGHNIYFQSNDTIHQWIGTRNGVGWNLKKTFVTGAANVAARVASVQSGNGNNQMMFATFKDGTLNSRKWNGLSWDAAWTYEGISNVKGSPYTLQLTTTTYNLYVRSSNGFIYQKYWNGSSFSAWAKISATSGATANPSSAYGNYQYLFNLSASGSAVMQAWNGYNWTGWSQFSFPGTKFLSPVKGGGNIVVYGIDANSTIWTANYSSNGTWNSATAVNCLPTTVN